MNEIKEIWKAIPGYEGTYLISNLGKVKSVRIGGTAIFINENRHGDWITLHKEYTGSGENLYIQDIVNKAFPEYSNIVLPNEPIEKSKNEFEAFIVKKHSGTPSIRFRYCVMDLVSALSKINKDINETKNQYYRVSTEKVKNGYALGIRYENAEGKRFYAYYTLTKEEMYKIKIEDYADRIKEHDKHND